MISHDHFTIYLFFCINLLNFQNSKLILVAVFCCTNFLKVRIISYKRHVVGTGFYMTIIVGGGG